MKNLGPLICGVLMLLALGAHGVDAAEELPKSAFKELMWDDLLPLDLGGDALFNPPNVHSPDYQQSPANEMDIQSQVMATVVPELNGQAVRIPGFIVPLEFDDDLTITEFFLVPYFGACIHTPPPPPNQIIFVQDSEGFQLEDIYTPFWISGVMQTVFVENEMAASAYMIDMQYLEEYEW